MGGACKDKIPDCVCFRKRASEHGVFLFAFFCASEPRVIGWMDWMRLAAMPLVTKGGLLYFYFTTNLDYFY
jgi:hypothetical protein